ncbi:MAG: phosphatidylglycerol lysyltransferase domain-containing protein, partial [Oscillospiraceae bacterium]|nr:phosphatidylglycerol lysyltransferase domain-containing protein [Oscillospiraceae bacterium]
MTLILTFRQIELSDREWIRPLIVASETRNSDFSFNNMFAWRHEYSQLIHKGDGFVLGRFNLDGESFVSFPIGVRDDRQLLEILQELRSTLAPLSLAGLSAEHVAALERIAPGEFTVTAPESLADYLYDIDRLASLSGKKLHAKRNHINRFEQEFPNRVFEPLTSENLGECLVTDGLWAYEKSDEQFDTIPGEIRALEQATTHFTALELDGGLVRLTPGGTVIAFTIGERLSRDTYVTHFE